MISESIEPISESKQTTWYLLLIAGLVLAVDQLTKYLVVRSIPLYGTIFPFPNLGAYFKITHTQNSGAAFGIFPSGGLFFTVIGTIVTVAIFYYYHQLPPEEKLARTALGMQLGGALGNLTDRFRQGYVVDFFHVTNFPVFNIADSAIVVGVSILILMMILEERENAQLEDADGDAEAAPASSLSAEGE